MAISPWAAVRNSAQPLPPDPGPWAQLDQTAEGQLANSSPAKLSPRLGVTPPPDVTLAPQEPTPLHNQLSHAAKRLGELQQKDQPYDWSAHSPLGKVAHVFSKIGNIAGSIVAPGPMSLIPGTDLNRKTEEAQLGKQIEDISGQEATNREKSANAGHLEAETPQVAPNAESTRTYQGAETRHANALSAGEEQLNAMGAPLKNLYDHLVSQDVAAGKDPSQNPDITRVGDAIQYLQKQTAPKALESKGGTWKGQQAFGNFHPDTGKYTDPHTGEEMVGFKPNEPASQMIPFMYNPQTNAPFRPSAGAPLPQGTMSLTQLGQGNEKDVQETQKTIGEVKSLSGVTSMMSQLARDNTGPSDFGIIMSFTGAVKPENVGKLRWQKAEQDYIEGLRSSYGDLEAWKNKIGSGQRLTDQEKQQMIHAVQVVQNAKAQEAGLQRNGNDWYAKGADGQWHLQ